MWDEVGAGGLGLPAPPGPLAAAVRPLGEGRWGTRTGAPRLGDVATLADEVRRGAVDDYVLAGVEGISGGALGVHYALVYGRVAIFVQVDQEHAAARLALAGRVQTAAITAAAGGRLPPGGSLLVVDTPYGLHHWEWTPQVEGGSDGLQGALDWLDELPDPAAG